MFALLWGVPFVTRGEGYSAGTASALLILFVLTNATLGPLIGSLAEKRESVRSSIIFWAPLAGMLAWIVVLGWPTRAPILLLVFLVVVIGIGGPTSMLSFDYTRMYVQKSQLGATNGFVNIGGFLASLTMMAAIGFLLDALNSGHKRATLYNLEHFRVALPIQFLVTIFGMVMYQVERRKTAQSELLAE
jgi:MFS family permease